MEKKMWIRPEAVVEQFAANEYVAACGDQNMVYKFGCDAGTRNVSYNVYFADGTPWASSDDDDRGQRFSGFHPCGETHEASVQDDFVQGYMYKQSSGGFLGFGAGQSEGEKIPVVIWTDGGTNVHCTGSLNISEWETAKS